MKNANALSDGSTPESHASDGPGLVLGFTEPAPPTVEETATGDETVKPQDEPARDSGLIYPSVSERGPPAELMERSQWVAYRLEADTSRPTKPKKIPYCSEQKRASTTDPATWLSYRDAVALAKGKGFAGIGFVFSKGRTDPDKSATPEDPYTGIDLDGVRDPATGAINTGAWKIVQDTGSYAEMSPSGTGIHLISRAKLKDGSLKTKTVEVYDRERFFTFTGQVLDGYDTVREAQTAVDMLVARNRPVKAKATGLLPPVRSADLSDEEILGLITSSRDAKAFHRLYIGGESRPTHTGSEDDFELACLIAKHVGGDVDRIARLMRGSALADRKKWDRKDYLPRTIQAALMSQQPAATTETSSQTSETLQRLSVANLARTPALFAPPAMLLARLVWAGRGTLFAGREKDGKTTYAAWAVVQAAKEGRTVLWLSTDEDQATIIGRFVHLVEQGLGITDPAERDAILDRLSVLDRDPTGWEEIEALHSAGWRPGVYVVDTLASFLMAVEGKVPETSEGERWHAKALRFKGWIKDSTSGILVLAHANRADGTYRGSTGIGAALDAIITLFGGLTDPCCRRLERKGRFGIGNDKVTIRYLGDDHPGFEEVETGPASTGEKRSFTDDELNALRRLSEAGKPLRAGEWDEGTKEQFNTSRAVVQRARKKAEAAGFISHTADRTRWQVTPAGWQFAASQKGWSPMRYPYEPATAVEEMA